MPISNTPDGVGSRKDEYCHTDKIETIDAQILKMNITGPMMILLFDTHHECLQYCVRGYQPTYDRDNLGLSCFPKHVVITGTFWH